jgi:hypothetical protein
MDSDTRALRRFGLRQARRLKLKMQARQQQPLQQHAIQKAALQKKKHNSGASGASTLTSLIRVGSDCSGVGTEVLALECIPSLAERVVHAFASEKDPKVRHILKTNHPHIRYIYEDVTERDVQKAPATDLYFNTSPCTTFSLMGKQDRTGHPHRAYRACVLIAHHACVHACIYTSSTHKRVIV